MGGPVPDSTAPPAPRHRAASFSLTRQVQQLLQARLEGTLFSLVPLSPAAAWRPWCFDRGSAGQGEIHGRPPELFKALRDEPYRRLTREQEAARRQAARRRGLQVRAEEVRPVQRSPARRPGDGTNGAE